jgi:hypothetical protein
LEKEIGVVRNSAMKKGREIGVKEKEYEKIKRYEGIGRR